MGSWGVGIFSDDVACDVRRQFRELLGQGKSAAETTRTILRDWKSALDDVEDGPVVWLALASLQCDHDCLQKTVKSKALSIIDRGNDLRRWEAVGDRRLVRGRKAALERLRAKLERGDTSGKATVKRPRPPRQRYIEPKSNWPIDELFAYRMSSGRHVVLHVVHHFGSKKVGYDPVFAVLNWRGKRLPEKRRLLSIPLKTRIDRFEGRKVFMIAVARLSEAELAGDRLQRLNVSRPRHVEKVNGGFYVSRWKDFDESLKHHLGWE